MVIDWARAQNPAVPWALMGHSLGGTIVAAFTLDEKRTEKPSRLVVVAPWLKLKMKVPAPKRLAANVVARRKAQFGQREEQVALAGGHGGLEVTGLGLGGGEGTEEQRLGVAG